MQHIQNVATENNEIPKACLHLIYSFQLKSVKMVDNCIKEIDSKIFLLLDEDIKKYLIKKYIDYEVMTYYPGKSLLPLANIMGTIKDFIELFNHQAVARLNKKNILAVGFIHLINFYISFFNEEQIKIIFDIFKDNLNKWKSELKTANTYNKHNDLIIESLKTIYACFFYSIKDDYNSYFSSILQSEEHRLDYPLYYNLILYPWDRFSENKQTIFLNLILTSLNHKNNIFIVNGLNFLQLHINELNDEQLAKLINPLFYLLDSGKITISHEVISYNNLSGLIYYTIQLPELLNDKLNLYMNITAKENTNNDGPGKIFYPKNCSTLFNNSLRYRKNKSKIPLLSNDKKNHHIKFD